MCQNRWQFCWQEHKSNTVKQQKYTMPIIQELMTMRQHTGQKGTTLHLYKSLWQKIALVGILLYNSLGNQEKNCMQIFIALLTCYFIHALIKDKPGAQLEKLLDNWVCCSGISKRVFQDITCIRYPQALFTQQKSHKFRHRNHVHSMPKYNWCRFFLLWI